MFGFGDGSIQFAALPKSFSLKADVAAQRRFVAAVYEVVQAGRNLRGEAGVAVNQKARFALRPNDSNIDGERSTIARLLNASELVIDPSFQRTSGIPVAMTHSGELLLVVEVDRTAEKERLGKEIAKLEADLKTTETKLANKSFIDRAPAVVVDEHRQRLKKFSEQLARLREARDQL